MPKLQRQGGVVLSPSHQRQFLSRSGLYQTLAYGCRTSPLGGGVADGAGGGGGRDGAASVDTGSGIFKTTVESSVFVTNVKSRNRRFRGGIRVGEIKIIIGTCGAIGEICLKRKMNGGGSGSGTSLVTGNFNIIVKFGSSSTVWLVVKTDISTI